MYDVCVITTIHQPLDARITDRGIRFYTESGFRTAVVCPWDYAPHTGVAPDAWRQTRFAANRGERLRLAWDTYRAALRTPARVYHFHDFDFLPWAVLLQRRTGRPVVYDCHEHYAKDALYHKPWIVPPLRRPLSFGIRILESWAARRLRHVIVVVPSMIDRFREIGIEAVLVKNISRVDPQPELQHDRALLYSGSVSAFYGSDTLLEIARILKRRGGTVPLVVPDRFYSPELRAQFVAAIAQEALPLRIVPQVPPSEMYRLLQLGSIGLVTDQDTPSMAHGMHAKFFDYMAAGLPIVAGDLANARQLIETAQNGVLVPPDDAEAYVDAALALLNDPDVLERLRGNGFRAFDERYSWRLERDRMLTFIRSLLGNSSTT
ncbi:MAG: glycosyltransferase [bacterium]